jgi:hypothetical protein
LTAKRAKRIVINEVVAERFESIGASLNGKQFMPARLH